MSITPEQEAEILRYYYAEKWRIGTISAQLNIHHYAVERVLRQEGMPRLSKVYLSIIDVYLPFIRETLEKFPTLTASRLYVMVRERGYAGSSSHFRYLVSLHRPRPIAEAYLRLVTLPGEQTQACPGEGRGGLGPFRAYGNRTRKATADGFRHGTVVVKTHLPALLPRCQNGKLFTRTRWCI